MAGTAAVVITYNSEEVIEACVAGLREFAPEVRVLVIDNASGDRTVERAREAGAEVIASSRRGCGLAAFVSGAADGAGGWSRRSMPLSSRATRRLSIFSGSTRRPTLQRARFAS